jgi:DNA-binding IscR family transcriptional regulator
MTKVRDAISDVLDRVTLADMVAMGEDAVPARAAATSRRRLR